MLAYRILPIALLSVSLMAIPFLRAPRELQVFSSLQRPLGAEGGENSAELFAARGEYESFQIAVLPREDGLKLLQVEASDLQDGRGSTISSENVAVYREHFVQVAGPLQRGNGSNVSAGPGLYADPLIPFLAPGTATLRAAPVDLDRTKPQVIWVDVFVPRDAPSGVYAGTIKVTTNQSAITAPMTVTVWDFELPLRPSLKSSFAFWTPQPPESIEELLRHKLMPLRVSADTVRAHDSRPIQSIEQDWVDRFGLSSVDAALWSGADEKNCVMRRPPSVKEVREAMSKHADALVHYNYTADEIINCKGLEDSLKEWARNLHAAGLKSLVVMPPVPQLLDEGAGSGRSAVDIWVVLPKLFEVTAPQIKEAIEKGDEVWSYNALAQDSYSPKWLINYAPINPRIQAGFLSQSLQLTGLLYWRIDRWSEDPWNDVNNVGDFSSANFPGEGLLVYPGADIGLRGVAPSIRLKQLRDGVEDFEYVEILKRLGKKDLAFDAARGIAPNWRNWSHEPAALEATRRRLGQQIHELSHKTTSNKVWKKGGV